MIVSLLLLASIAQDLSPLEEIDAEAGFCLGLAAQPNAVDDLLKVRELRGWDEITNSKTNFRGLRFDVKTFQLGNYSTSVAVSPKRKHAYCQFAATVNSNNIASTIALIEELYLARAATFRINPYEFASGVGETVHVEVPYETKDVATLQFTISTTEVRTPF